MKTFKRILIWIGIGLGLCLSSLLASAQSATLTGFTAQMVNPDGSPQTNQVLFYPWPLPTFQFFVVGTNVVNGNYIVTNTPNASGYFTNQLLPGQYVGKIPAMGNTAWFYAQVPAVAPGAAQLSLSSFVSNAPAIYINASNYSYLTNLFGGPLVTNSYFGIISAMGMIPQIANPALTNLSKGLTFSLTNSGIIESFDGLGEFTQSNTATHQWLSISNCTLIYDGYVQPTNFVFAFDQTNSAFIAQTNAELFATTNHLAVTNQTGFTGDVTNLVGQTNLTLAIVAPGGAGGTSCKITYDSKGRVTGTNSLGLTDLPNYVLSPYTVGTNNGSTIFSVVTNGFEVLIAYQTNGPPGPAFTNFPWGTICTTTNGQTYTLSNMVWWAHF
jgi:hypothetical protein